MCRHCNPRDCRDAPTEDLPAMVRCPQCEGAGCDECHDGAFAVVGCPQQLVREVMPVIECCELLEAGITPMGRGGLDQTRWFLDASRFVRFEEAYWKAVMGVGTLERQY